MDLLIMRPTMASSSRSSRWLRSVSVVAMVALVACKEDDWTCAGTPDPGIELTVIDGLGGANLETLAVVTVARLSPRSTYGSGAPVEVGRLTAAPGTYELQIVARGYASRTDTVTVASRPISGCPKTVTQSRIIPLSPDHE